MSEKIILFTGLLTDRLMLPALRALLDHRALGIKVKVRLEIIDQEQLKLMQMLMQICHYDFEFVLTKVEQEYLEEECERSPELAEFFLKYREKQNPAAPALSELLEQCDIVCDFTGSTYDPKRNLQTSTHPLYILIQDTPETLYWDNGCIFMFGINHTEIITSPLDRTVPFIVPTQTCLALGILIRALATLAPETKFEYSAVWIENDYDTDHVEGNSRLANYPDWKTIFQRRVYGDTDDGLDYTVTKCKQPDYDFSFALSRVSHKWPLKITELLNAEKLIGFTSHTAHDFRRLEREFGHRGKLYNYCYVVSGHDLLNLENPRIQGYLTRGSFVLNFIALLLWIIAPDQWEFLIHQKINKFLPKNI